MANIDCSHLFTWPGYSRLLKFSVSKVASPTFTSRMRLIQHGDLPPGRGKAPMQEYVNELAKAGFDGSVTCELEWPPDPSREGIIAWTKEAGDATAALMKNVGVRG